MTPNSGCRSPVFSWSWTSAVTAVAIWKKRRASAMGERGVERGAARSGAAWLPERTGFDIGHIVSILIINIKKILLLTNINRNAEELWRRRTVSRLPIDVRSALDEIRYLVRALDA